MRGAGRDLRGDPGLRGRGDRGCSDRLRRQHLRHPPVLLERRLLDRRPGDAVHQRHGSGGRLRLRGAELSRQHLRDPGGWLGHSGRLPEPGAGRPELLAAASPRPGLVLALPGLHVTCACEALGPGPWVSGRALGCGLVPSARHPSSHVLCAGRGAVVSKSRVSRVLSMP